MKILFFTAIFLVLFLITNISTLFAVNASPVKNKNLLRLQQQQNGSKTASGTKQLSRTWTFTNPTEFSNIAGCQADNEESFFLLDYNNRFIRASSSTGSILWNFTIPPLNNIKTQVFGNDLVQKTSSSSGTNYIAVQRLNSVVVYSFSSSTQQQQAQNPTLILELAWAHQTPGLFYVKITDDDTLLVPYLDSDGVTTQFRAYNINPNAPSSTNRTNPIFSTTVSTGQLSGWVYSSGVGAFYDSNGRTQAFDTKSGAKLWAKPLGDASSWSGLYTAEQSGLFFNQAKIGSPSLGVIDAASGNTLFVYTAPSFPIYSVSSVKNQPDLVRILCSGHYVILNSNFRTVTKSVPFGDSNSNGYREPELLLNDTVVLAFGSEADNFLWGLTPNNNKQLGPKIPWFCTVIYPHNVQCNRPQYSAKGAVLSQDQQSLVFTISEPQGDGYSPTILDATTGAVLSTVSDGIWAIAPSVIAVSSSSGVAAYVGAIYQGTGNDFVYAASGYRYD